MQMCQGMAALFLQTPTLDLSDSHFKGQRQRTLKMGTLARTQLLFENITLLEVPENQ